MKRFSWIALIIGVVMIGSFSSCSGPFEPSSTAYLVPRAGHTAAVDARGLRHVGTDYKDTVPWLTDIVKHPAPEYPYKDRLHRHQGRGVIRVSIDLNTGSVTDVKVVTSTGFATLDASAVAAFRQWIWKPGKWKQVELPVTFTIAGQRATPWPKGATRLSPGG